MVLMLITNDITIFHKGVDLQTRLSTWSCTHFLGVSCQKDTKVSVLGDGLKSANVVRIRIPTVEDVAICNGDKVCFGNAETLPQDAFTVIGFADNRKGSRDLWHWKVICA